MNKRSGAEVGLVVGPWMAQPRVVAREEGFCRELRVTKLETREIVEPLNAKPEILHLILWALYAKRSH